MKKRRFQSGGDTNTVPASRQNIEQRTPSGVRPVASPVVPVGNVQGTMKNGGELKMKKTKKMAMGGMPGPMPVDRGRGASRGGGGAGFAGTGRPPASSVGTAGNLPGGFMGGSMMGAGPGGRSGGKPDQMRYPMAPTRSFPTGPQAFSPDGAQFAQNAGPLKGGFLGGPGSPMGPGAGGMPMGGGMGGMGSGGPGDAGPMFGDPRMQGKLTYGPYRPGPQDYRPGMKKGGKVSASSYNDMTGGAGGGMGRLEKTSIASKTKAQKMKKGGKVKGYGAGGMMSMDDIIVANQKLNPDFKLPAGYEAKARVELENMQADPAYQAYIARQDAAEKRARKAAPKKTSKPADGGAASRSMSPGKGMSSAARDDRSSSPNRRATSGRDDRSSSLTEDNGDMVGPMSPYPSGGRRASSGGKRTPQTSPIEGGVSFPIEGGGSSPRSRSLVPGGPLPIPPTDFRTGRRKEKSLLERLFSLKPPTPEERDAAYDKVNKSGMFGGDIYYNTGRLGEGVTGFGKKKGGKVKMAKGGKVKNFEGSATDMAQDKKLAKKYGMSKKAYEKSEIDAKHDKQKSMKGLKMGGMSKMAAGGMSTAQDGMKGALRPKPSAMAMGGKVKRMAEGGNSKEGFSYPYEDQALRQLGRENERPSKKGFDYPRTGPMGKALDSLDRAVGLAPSYPNFKMDDAGKPFKGRTDPKGSISGPSRKQSAMIMGENKSQGETGGKDYKNNGRLLGLYPMGRKSRVKADQYGTLRQMDDARDKEPVNEVGMKKGGKAEMHAKGCKCMACGGMAKMAKGGAVGMTFGKPLPGTKLSSQKIRATTATGASMKKDGMKGQLRAKASGAKPTNMMKPLGMTKMAKGGKVRGAGIAQRGTKFIGEV